MSDYDPSTNETPYGEPADGAHFGPWALRFYIRIDPRIPVLRAEKRHPMWDTTFEVIGADYARQVDEAIGEGLVGAPITARARPWGGPRTGGPLPDQQEIVWLLGVAGDALGAIVNLAAGAVLVRAAIDKARAFTKNDVTISDGVAVMLAAELVDRELGDRDLTLAFVTNLSKHTVGLDEVDSRSDGWLVGFRTPERLVMARVDGYGTARLVSADVPLTPPRV